jgi:TP901 family phage tail tape measure protein
MAGKFSIEAIFKARDNMSRVVSRIGRRWTRVARHLGRVTRAADRAVNGLARGFRRAGLAAGAASVAVGLLAKNVMDAGAGFEQAITNVAAVGLKTRGEIADLEERAKQLGATTKFTATEAANAMEIMARAGFKNQEILSGIDGVLNAAAASGLEIAEVADHVSNALKGMGLETSEAGRVADVLALASARTNSTIGTLGESLRNVAATARQVGVPFEDVTAAVASLQDVGLDASVAGSSLNTMLTKMAKPPAAVAAQMKKFGVSFKDAEGNMLPFEKVIENISIAAEKAGGNFDQVAFLADLVGLRGQKAAANLAHLFKTGKLKELTAELYEAGGAAEQMAKTRMDTLIGDWTLLKSAVDGVKVALFDAESGPLRKFIQRITSWVSENQDRIIVKIGEVFDKIAEAARKAQPVIDTFFDAFKGGFRAGDAADHASSRFEQFTAWLQKPETLESAATWGKLLGNAADMLLRLTTAVGSFLPEIVMFMIAVKLAKGVMVAYEIATMAVASAKALYAAATGGATLATIGHTAKTVIATGAAYAQAAANGVATASFWALAAAAAAAAAAVAAILLAIDQAAKLEKETGGLGITGIVGGMIEQGTWDPFEVVDRHMNKQAQREAEERERRQAREAGQGEAGMVTPGERSAAALGESMKFDPIQGEIAIKDETGKAQVIKVPKGLALRLEQSGAF